MNLPIEPRLEVWSWQQCAMIVAAGRPDARLHSAHSPGLVALSILISVFASYTALDLTGRARACEGVTRAVWLAASAVAMGGGIWSMHFVAMMAFQLGIPIGYDVRLTFLSF